MRKRWLWLGAGALGALALGAYHLSMPQERSLSCAEKEPRIVAFGDSLVTGYGAPEGEGFVPLVSGALGVAIENQGLNGDTAASALRRVDEALRSDPDIVIVLLGGNDALQGVPVEWVEESLSAILERVVAAGAQPVLLGVLGGFPQDPYAPMFRRLAEASGAKLVPNVLSGVITDRALMSDPIHPNAEGYARMAARVAPAVLSACETL